MREVTPWRDWQWKRCSYCLMCWIGEWQWHDWKDKEDQYNTRKVVFVAVICITVGDTQVFVKDREKDIIR